MTPSATFGWQPGNSLGWEWEWGSERTGKRSGVSLSPSRLFPLRTGAVMKCKNTWEDNPAQDCFFNLLKDTFAPSRFGDLLPSCLVLKQSS